MILKKLLKGFDFKLLKENCLDDNDDSNLNLDVCDIIYDSRKVKPGCVFVCLIGTKFDGHCFVKQAIERGAVAIVASHKVDTFIPSNISLILVNDTRYALACMSVEFFSNPSKELTTIAITGTKGKTTTCAMIKTILDKSGVPCGSIGTLGIIFKDQVFKSSNTTPESYEIQQCLRMMVDSGCKTVVMETSSLGLKTHRCAGIHFDYAIFTNFSRDHISEEEHSNLEDYKFSKSLLFRNCDVALVNIDDPAYKDILKAHNCKVLSYSFNELSADYKASDIRTIKKSSTPYIKFSLQKPFKTDIELSIFGKFNAYNALAALAVCNELKVPTKFILSGLLDTKVKGRTEVIPVPGNFVLVIDYAHTDLSLKNILSSLRESYHPKKLICMFGAAGSRDKYRRYGMGEVAGTLADLSVITEEDPREEDVNNIIKDIQDAISKTSGKSVAIPNRKEAIQYCLKIAQEGDVVLLAGKGQENFQDKKGVIYHFNDMEIVQEFFNCQK